MGYGCSRFCGRVMSNPTLVLSDAAKKIIPSETPYTIETVAGLADRVYEQDDLTAVDCQVLLTLSISIYLTTS